MTSEKLVPSLEILTQKLRDVAAGETEEGFNMRSGYDTDSPDYRLPPIKGKKVPVTAETMCVAGFVFDLRKEMGKDFSISGLGIAVLSQLYTPVDYATKPERYPAPRAIAVLEDLTRQVRDGTSPRKADWDKFDAHGKEVENV